MINKNTEYFFPVALTLGAAVAVLGSIRFLDREIASAVMKLLHSRHILDTATAKIPDALLFLVCFGTAIMWLAYIYLSRNKAPVAQLRFLQLAATAVPSAYLLKAFLKFIFGRTNTRSWLLSGEPLQFNWFHGAGTGSFPSGHMTVFTAFGATIWYYCPRYRRHTLLALVLLGTALIATDYHFLSDVIAGSYVGLIVTTVVRYGLDNWVNMAKSSAD